jgi:mono/diheme cytochrome c family protein
MRRLLSSSNGGLRRHLGIVLLVSLALAALSACHHTALPELGTADEQLYAQRCGACHRAYQPSTLTPAMWQMQVEAMELKMTAAGQPLSPGDETAILAYLQRHASGAQ